MTKFCKFYAILALLGAVTLSSCGDDNTSNTDFNGSEVPFDAKSDREYLEQTANLFLGYFDAGHQREAITAMNEFVHLCKTYRLPDNYSDDRYYDLQTAAAAYVKAAETNDFSGMSRATTELVYNLARFQGLYQANANTQTWDKIEDRDHIDFRFWIGSTEFNLTLQGDGGSWSDSHVSTDFTYKVEIPRNLALNMYKGSTQPYTSLMSARITTDVKNNEYANIRVNGNFANIVLESTINATSSKITENSLVSIDNVSTLVRTKLFATETTINGHDLCSAAVWDKIITDKDDAHKAALIGDVVSSFSNTVMFMQRVQLKSSSEDIAALIEYPDGVWDKSNSPNPEQSAKDAAAYLSRTFTSKMYYAGDRNLVRGTVGWEAYQCDDMPGANEWAVRPTLTLASDASVTDFESFFGNGRFFSVERNFQNLLNGYKSYWK